MAQEIPITSAVPWYDLTVPLDNGDGTTSSWTFEFKWNVRDSSWYFNLYDQSNGLVISSVKVVLGMYLGRRSAHSFFHGGVLVAIDTAAPSPGQGREAAFDDFGTRVKLVRFTAQEIVTGRAARGASDFTPPANWAPWWVER